MHEGMRKAVGSEANLIRRTHKVWIDNMIKGLEHIKNTYDTVIFLVPEKGTTIQEERKRADKYFKELEKVDKKQGGKQA